MSAGAGPSGGFFDGVTMVYIVDTITKPQVLLFLTIALLAPYMAFRGERALTFLRRAVDAFSFGGLEVKFREISEELEENKRLTEAALETIDQLVVDRSQYDAVAEDFDGEAPAVALDKLAARLKTVAGGVTDVSSYVDDLAPGATEAKVFAAAVLASRRPEPAFAAPFALQMDHLAADDALRGFRLKTLYRLVMAMEEVARADNVRDPRLIDGKLRGRMARALERLARSPRPRADDSENGRRGIGARIQRALKVLQEN
ncbi:hypothetical protein N0B44_07380 [Roseibacterium beibuensis]|uniref:hypothetical protein n=1 Tax=[Roseibacterium] beibuensis TaxID=1193142 RepID=UPI00217D61AD|nr:hypothetical protein [Roseibacterium beibuensis]MCS6622727.1 hypothetical protein [Roseibacterium beibuensis]